MVMGSRFRFDRPVPVRDDAGMNEARYTHEDATAIESALTSHGHAVAFRTASPERRNRGQSEHFRSTGWVVLAQGGRLWSMKVAVDGVELPWTPADHATMRSIGWQAVDRYKGTRYEKPDMRWGILTPADGPPADIAEVEAEEAARRDAQPKAPMFSMEILEVKPLSFPSGNIHALVGDYPLKPTDR